MDTLKICFLPALDSASDLKLSIVTIRMYLKLRRIAGLVVVVVVILFRRHASDKFQEAISCIEAEPGDFSCIAYLSSMLSLTISGEVMFLLIKIN